MASTNDGFRSHETFHSSAAPSSPPYEHATTLPPTYQSRTNLREGYLENGAMPSSQHDRDTREALQQGQAWSRDEKVDKGKRASPPSSMEDAVGSQAPRPAQRVVATDPLADMRARNLSRPEGLPEHSDYPLNFQTPVTPSTPRGQKVSGNNSEAETSDGEGQDFDDFDWDDDDNVEQDAKYQEEVKAVELRMGRFTLWKVLRFLGTTFLGNFIISVLLLVPVLVMQFVYRSKTQDRPMTPAEQATKDHRDYVADNVQAWFIWAAFNLHVEWWLHILVEIVPRVFIFAFRIVWGNVGQKVLSLAEFYNAIKGYIKPILYAALGWGSWAILFNSIYGLYTHSDPQTSRASYTYRLYQVVEFFFFFTVTICAEKIVIKCIAMSFHRSAYAERIAEITKALSVFDRLKDYRPKRKPEHGHASKLSAFGLRSGRNSPSAQMTLSPAGPLTPAEYAGDDEGNSPKSTTRSKKHAERRPGISRRQSDYSLHVSEPHTPTNVQEQKHASKAAGARRVIKSTAAQASTLARVAMTDPFGLLATQKSGLGADINSPYRATKLAKDIFYAFRGSHKRTYLIPSDFSPAFPSAEEAKDAFMVFDRDGNGDISQSEIKNTVLKTYKERRFLARSMHDVNHAVGQLDFILMIIACVIIIFEALAIFNLNVDKLITTMYTLGIAFAFVFKESAQNIFDSIVFLFVTHPFDTGDRIMLDEAVMCVKRMSLLSSEFTLADGTDMYVANSVLASMSVINLRRSGYQWECATIQVAFDTPLAALDAVEADLIKWLQTEPERLFEPSTSIVPQTIDYMRSIECTVGMTHRANWQDWGARFYRRNAFFAALTFYLKKHGVRYASANQPVIYWTEDAAQLPPSYDEEQNAGPINDNFAPSPPNSPLPGGDNAGPSTAAATRPAATSKPRSFMNFTPPPDEIDAFTAAGLRARKAKRGRKALVNQGGDG